MKTGGQIAIGLKNLSRLRSRKSDADRKKLEIKHLDRQMSSIQIQIKKGARKLFKLKVLLLLMTK